MKKSEFFMFLMLCSFFVGAILLMLGRFCGWYGIIGMCFAGVAAVHFGMKED